MGNGAVSSWLHGFFLASSEPQNGASAKKKYVFEIRGHAFLGGNQSWYVIKQNNYLWKFSCIFDVTFFFYPRFLTLECKYLHWELSM